MAKKQKKSRQRLKKKEQERKTVNLLRQGTQALHNGEITKAVQLLERSHHLDPKNPDVALNLGLIYRDRQEKDEALHWFRQAVEANPNDRDAKHFIEQLSQDNEETS